MDAVVRVGNASSMVDEEDHHIAPGLVDSIQAAFVRVFAHGR
jgi:hypothetical protein